MLLRVIRGCICFYSLPNQICPPRVTGYSYLCVSFAPLRPCGSLLCAAAEPGFRRDLKCFLRVLFGPAVINFLPPRTLLLDFLYETIIYIVVSLNWGIP